MACTVLIVDDHPTFRSMARVLLEADGFEVVGMAPDCGAGMAAIHELRPDVVLLDVRLPDRDGFNFAAELCAEPGAPQVVVTSSSDDPRYPDRARECGALGFIAKHDIGGPYLKSLLSGALGRSAGGWQTS